MAGSHHPPSLKIMSVLIPAKMPAIMPNLWNMWAVKMEVLRLAACAMPLRIVVHMLGERGLCGHSSLKMMCGSWMWLWMVEVELVHCFQVVTGHRHLLLHL